MMAKKALSIVAADVAVERTARSEAKVPGEPLNFRVQPDFGRRFRVYAAERRMRLSDVLVQAFEALEQREHGSPGVAADTLPWRAP